MTSKQLEAIQRGGFSVCPAASAAGGRADTGGADCQFSAGGQQRQRRISRSPAWRPDVVLTTMKSELNRAKTALAKSDPAPYFLSYTVYDQDQIVIAASYGGILSNSTTRRRTADVTMRVGTPQLDNTHGQSRGSGMTSGSLPLNDDHGCGSAGAVGTDGSRVQTGGSCLSECENEHRGAGGGRG